MVDVVVPIEKREPWLGFDDAVATRPVNSVVHHNEQVRHHHRRHDHADHEPNVVRQQPRRQPDDDSTDGHVPREVSQPYANVANGGLMDIGCAPTYREATSRPSSGVPPRGEIRVVMRRVDNEDGAEGLEDCLVVHETVHEPLQRGGHERHDQKTERSSQQSGQGARVGEQPNNPDHPESKDRDDDRGQHDPPTINCLNGTRSCSRTRKGDCSTVNVLRHPAPRRAPRNTATRRQHIVPERLGSPRVSPDRRLYGSEARIVGLVPALEHAVLAQ